MIKDVNDDRKITVKIQLRTLIRTNRLCFLPRAAQRALA